MTRKIILHIFLFLPLATAYGERVRGVVTDDDGPIPGVTVSSPTRSFALTDHNGEFSVQAAAEDTVLIFTMLGYEKLEARITDSLLRVRMQPLSTDLETITIDSYQRGSYIDRNSAIKTDLMTFGALTKMACCNLAESFENSATVTVGYSDAVSGTRQIRMLGLSGVYSQLTDESRPVFRGMSSSYGLTFVPGMWLQNIHLSKGVTSVVNGHEAMTGQINLEPRKPEADMPLFINGYLDERLRSELNVTSSLTVAPGLSTVILAHGSLDRLKEDHNRDGFLDNPTSGQLNFGNRWFYAAPNGMQVRAGWQAVRENRQGGQKSFRPSRDKGGSAVYGSEIDNTLFNGYLKAAVPYGTGFMKDGELSQSSIALIADYAYFHTDSYFGRKEYDGRQNSVSLRLVANHFFSPRHSAAFGLSALLDNYRESYLYRPVFDPAPGAAPLVPVNAFTGDRIDREAGAFAEYNFRAGERFNWIAGVRADYHDRYRWIWTPRTHIRWEFADGVTLRGSAGRGARSPLPFTDQMGPVMATGRMVSFDGDPYALETGWTYGGSLTWQFRLGQDENTTLSFDYFHTRFGRQSVADQEYDPLFVYVYSTDGKAYTHTWQGDFTWTPARNFEVFATFRYNLNRLTLDRPDGTRYTTEKPLTDRFKTLLNLQYATKYRRWVFDATAQLNGQTRLPSLDGNVSEKEYSPVYPIFFAQVTRKFRKFEVYLGGENLGGYTQSDPVLSPDDPFGAAFNSSVVWGPLMGRRIYAGFRFNL